MKEIDLCKLYLMEEMRPEFRDAKWLSNILDVKSGPSIVPKNQLDVTKEKLDQVKFWDEIPPSWMGKKHWFVLTSGGIGSSSSLWSIINKNIPFRCIHFENSFFNKQVETKRRSALTEIFLQSKTSNGSPLWIKGQGETPSLLLTTYPFFSEPFLHHWSKESQEYTATLHKEIHKIPWNQRKRIAWILARIEFIIKSNGADPQEVVLVWGNVQQEIYLIDALCKESKISNVLFHRNPCSSILSLADCETRMENIHQLYKESAFITYQKAMFPRRCLHIFCSCQKSDYVPDLPEKDDNNRKSTSILELIQSCEQTKEEQQQHVDFDDEKKFEIPNRIEQSKKLEVKDEQKKNAIQYHPNGEIPEVWPSFHPTTFAKNCDRCQRCQDYKGWMTSILVSVPSMVWGDRERFKLQPIVPLTSKQKLEKWILPGRKFIPIYKQPLPNIFRWEKEKDKGKKKGKEDPTVVEETKVKKKTKKQKAALQALIMEEEESSAKLSTSSSMLGTTISTEIESNKETALDEEEEMIALEKYADDDEDDEENNEIDDDKIDEIKAFEGEEESDEDEEYDDDGNIKPKKKKKKKAMDEDEEEEFEEEGELFNVVDEEEVVPDHVDEHEDYGDDDYDDD